MEHYRRRGQQLDAARKRFELRDELAPLGSDGVAVRVRDNRVVVELPGDALFDTGRETLRRRGQELVLAVAGVIRADPALAARSYQVAGHVDAAARAAPSRTAGASPRCARARCSRSCSGPPRRAAAA